MSFKLKEVVPWGRNIDEYVSMFNLSEEDLRQKVLGCADGPASFNATLTQQGGKVISIDPIYQFSTADIQRRVEETYDVVLKQITANKQEFIWNNIKSPTELGDLRMKAMMQFLSDYPQGVKEGRYIAGSLPELPFASKQFDLALCSHFLFLYSEYFSEDFHMEAIIELCRVSKEVRIFPLLELGAKKSRHLNTIISRLEQLNYDTSIELVPYEFQKNGNKMLKIKQH